MTTTWRIACPTPVVTANDSLTWPERHRYLKAIKHSIGWGARQQHIPNLDRRAAVWLEMTPATRRRRDPSNLMPTQKAALDGLVAVGVLTDDTPEYVDERMPVIHPPRGRPANAYELVVQEVH